MNLLRVPSTLDSLRAIAEYVMEAADSAGLNKGVTYRLRLAVDEVATNIIVHGYPASGHQGDLDLQATIDDGALTIAIEDNGVPYDPHQDPPDVDLDSPLKQRPIGGLGIYLAKQNVDQFIYERVGERNRNILIVNRDSQTTAQ